MSKSKLKFSRGSSGKDQSRYWLYYGQEDEDLGGNRTANILFPPEAFWTYYG